MFIVNKTEKIVYIIDWLLNNGYSKNKLVRDADRVLLQVSLKSGTGNRQ